MIFEKCLDCKRPAEEHYYAIKDTIVESNLRNVKEQFFLSEQGWYPLYTKWTRIRMSRAKFAKNFCVPHRLYRIRIEVGNLYDRF